MKHYTPAGWVDEPSETIGPRWATKEDYEWALDNLKVRPKKLVSAVVYALAANLKDASAVITSIPCDMWCAVAAWGAPYETKGMLAMTGDEGKVVTWIQCDEVEWGFAATWKAMVEHFGEVS